MGKKRPKCERCQLRGYSSDFCKLHSRTVTKEDCENCDSHRSLKFVGKTAALGAGFGVVATALGVVAAPVAGLTKVAIGHAVAAKMTAGGGVAGAGVNMARKAVIQKSGDRQTKKKRVLLPLYLKRS